jgi:PAS domain-containing protein
LASVVAHLPGIGLWRVRSDGAVWWSPNQYAFFGIDPAEGVPPAADLFRMYHPDDANIVARVLRDCFKNSRPSQLTYRVIRPGGKLLHLHSWSVRVEPDAHGRVSVVGMDTDITDRDLELQRVQASERGFRFVADNTRDLIVRYKPDSELIFLSRACRAVIGYEPRELVGVRTITLLHPDDVERAAADTEALFSSGRSIAGHPGGVPVSPQGRPLGVAGEPPAPCAERGLEMSLNRSTSFET